MPVRSMHLSLRLRCPVFDVAGAGDTTFVLPAYFYQPIKLTLAFVRVLADIRRLARLSYELRVVTFSTKDVFSASHVDASDSNVTAVISLGCPVWVHRRHTGCVFSICCICCILLFSENHVFVAYFDIQLNVNVLKLGFCSNHPNTRKFLFLLISNCYPYVSKYMAAHIYGNIIDGSAYYGLAQLLA